MANVHQLIKPEACLWLNGVHYQFITLLCDTIGSYVLRGSQNIDPLFKLYFGAWQAVVLTLNHTRVIASHPAVTK